MTVFASTGLTGFGSRTRQGDIAINRLLKNCSDRAKALLAALCFLASASVCLAGLQPKSEFQPNSAPERVALPSVCFPGSYLSLDSHSAQAKARDSVISLNELRESLTSFLTKAPARDVIAFYETMFDASFRESSRSSEKCQIWGSIAQLGLFTAKVSVTHWSERNLTMISIVENPTIVGQVAPGVR